MPPQGKLLSLCPAPPPGAVPLEPGGADHMPNDEPPEVAELALPAPPVILNAALEIPLLLFELQVLLFTPLPPFA